MSAKNREFVWSDEFDGPSGSPPNPAFWTHETGDHGWGNGELQNYTGDATNAFHDGNGNLVLRAIRGPTGYTSARLITKRLVEGTYGRIECRAKLPQGGGLWSAFWALGSNIDEVAWPGCGEIDILENIGSEPVRVFGTIHCPGHSKEHGLSGDMSGRVPLSEGFHIYGVDWTSDRIAWSLDDQVYHEVTRSNLGSAWVFDHPFYLLLNLAVGGWLGGDVRQLTSFPADLTLDYVRWLKP